MVAVPRRSWLESAAAYGGAPSPLLVEGTVGAVPCHSWQGTPAGVCWAVGSSTFLLEGPLGAAPRPFSPGCASGLTRLVGGPSSFLSERPVDALPGHSWLEPSAGFGWGGAPWSILPEGPVGAVPHGSWLGPASGFPGVAGPSPLLAEGPVAVLPAIPGWELLLVLSTCQNPLRLSILVL